MKLDRDDRYDLDDKAEELVSRSRRFRCDKISGLCGRCTSAHIFRMKHRSEPVIICQQLGQRVPDNIESCSKFSQQGRLSILDLAKIAHVIDNRDEYKGDYR